MSDIVALIVGLIIIGAIIYFIVTHPMLLAIVVAIIAIFILQVIYNSGSIKKMECIL